MNLLRKLLPTREEGRKLWFEVYKVPVVVGITSLVGIAVTALWPPLRSAIVSAAVATWDFWNADHTISMRGWLLTFAGFFILAGCIGILRRGFRLVGPTHLRKFLSADYDGIVWIWSWRKQRVDDASMTPFCPKCTTELLLTYQNNAFGGADVKVGCTTCNSVRVFNNVDDLKRHVIAKIEGDARTGRWKTKALRPIQT